MANITVPIQVNLPDDWIEQIVNRLRNDPESEWAEIIRCRDCKNWDKTWTPHFDPGYHYCSMIDGVREGNFYCADGKRREEDVKR